jgi:hypothetical protein
MSGPLSGLTVIELAGLGPAGNDHAPHVVRDDLHRVGGAGQSDWLVVAGGRL